MTRPNTHLTTSQTGLALIKAFEGLRLTPYLCPADKWTAGWGHVLSRAEFNLHVVQKLPITLQMAHAWLINDCKSAEADVASLVNVRLTQYQFDALVSFVYNFGKPKFSTSTLLRKLNAGDLFGAAAEFKRWRNVQNKHWTPSSPPEVKRLVPLAGLVRRRAAEAKLFMGGGFVDERKGRRDYV